MCSGQIESAEFYGVDNLYCKYTFYYGQHWAPVAGVETAVSQISRKGREQSTVVTWNFPLEVTFRASNAHGWPRIVLSMYVGSTVGDYNVVSAVPCRPVHVSNDAR